MATVLYVTQDGITDHIGQAQIAPYLLGLAACGHSIHVVSAEKPNRTLLIARYAKLFDRAGIRWTRVRYANRPPLISSFYTMSLLRRAAFSVVRREQSEIVHCRSYLPLGIGSAIKAKFGTRYLADFRDFWADVGIETKRFKFVYRYYRRREGALLRNADHVVTLTERARDILIARHPLVVSGRPDRYTVIPCCADFDMFDPARVTENQTVALRRQLNIGERAYVLLYLGSLGPDYLLPEMFDLFDQLRAIDGSAVFVILANNGKDHVERIMRERRLDMDAVRFMSVPREEIVRYMTLATLSVVFIRPTESKAGCSPTKLGELMAANIPVVANANVGDLDRQLSLDRNGSVVVADFSPDSLRRALEQILALPASTRARIRGNSTDFSLEAGVRRYDRIYRSLAERVA